MSTLFQRLAGFILLGVIVLAVVAGFQMWNRAASAAQEDSREGWPDDTPLAQALSEYSHRHEALEGLYPVLAEATLYVGAGGNCRGNYMDTNPERLYFVVDRRDGGDVYYAFDTLERLTSWAHGRQSRACYLEVTGAWFAAVLSEQGEPSRLLMNDGGPGYVMLDPDDLTAVAALGG